LFAQTTLVAGVGAAVMYFDHSDRDSDPVLLAVGLGIVAYAIAVAFCTLLGIVRLRRAFKAESRKLSESLVSK